MSQDIDRPFALAPVFSSDGTLFIADGWSLSLVGPVYSRYIRNSLGEGNSMAMNYEGCAIDTGAFTRVTSL